MSDLEAGFRIVDVIDLLRRRSAVVLGAAVVGIILGYVAFASSATTYSATSRVQVQPLTDPLDNSVSSDAKKLDVATELDLVKSDAVGDAVRKELGLSGDNRSLFGALTVTSKTDSLVLELTVKSGSAERARDIANAVADAYLGARRRDAKSTQDKALVRVGQEITDAQTALTEANAALATTTSGTPERSAAQSQVQQAQAALTSALSNRTAYANLDTTAVGRVVRKAPTPQAVLSKLAVAKGVGVFGLCVLAGLGIALLIDRRDAMGGGRRRVAQLAPDANLRILPSARGQKASPAEIDAAIDRLAVELAAGGSRGRATSVLVVGTRVEPPVGLAEELAASLTFAGIPALFVLAGSSTRELRQAQVVTSFTDLITGPSITGPASLPEVAGAQALPAAPTVTWLRPRGSAEASGLLRRAVVEALITRAGREGFEVVVFVASTPTRNAAAAALGQWVTKSAVVVEDDDSQGVEEAVSALREAEVKITEVVWA